MLSLWTAAVLLANPAGPQSGPIELSAPTALALEIAEGVGAVTKNLNPQAHPSVTGAERAALEDALMTTGLFELSDTPEVPVLFLRRVDQAMLATVTNARGERVWVGQTPWARGAAQSVAEPQDSEDRYNRVLLYRRQRLSLQPIARTFWSSPLAIGVGFTTGPAGPFVARDRWHAQGSLSHLPPAGPISHTITTDWGVLQGSAGVLDEVDFAQLIGDDLLLSEVRETRAQKQLWWGVGFGLAAAAGIGSGLALDAASEDRENRAAVVSLITLGAASAVLALLFPRVGTQYTQSKAEAQRRVDLYNAKLRRELDVKATDLRDFPNEE